MFTVLATNLLIFLIAKNVYQRNKWKKIYQEKIFFVHFYFQSRKLITILIWIQSLNRKTLKMKMITQIQFTRKNGRKKKKEKYNSSKKCGRILPNIIKTQFVPKTYIFSKERKNAVKMFYFFYCVHFVNTFLELITNLTIMHNLKKLAWKIKAQISLENLCHLRGNVPIPLLNKPSLEQLAVFKKDFWKTILYCFLWMRE